MGPKIIKKKHPGHLVTIPLVYMWGDAHFYWTHRLLHTPWLYKRFGEETMISVVIAFYSPPLLCNHADMQCSRFVNFHSRSKLYNNDAAGSRSHNTIMS